MKLTNGLPFSTAGRGESETLAQAARCLHKTNRPSPTGNTPEPDAPACAPDAHPHPGPAPMPAQDGPVKTSPNDERTKLPVRRSTAKAGWSPQAREAARARMLARKIWTRSTGPRTAKGKAA